VREHQSVCGAEIDGEVGRKQTEHRPHVVTVLVHPYFPPRRKSLRRPAGKSAEGCAISLPCYCLRAPRPAQSAMVCRSEFLLGHDDGNLRMPRSATAVLPHHHNSMLSRLQLLGEMTEGAVGRNIRDCLAIHNQRLARLGFSDNVSNSPVKLVACNL